jgi:putative DNA primase/helicase
MFEIVNALLGKENVCNFTLQNLTMTEGYYRAKIANKLVNYASEINNRMNTDVFKQLASGEPVEARNPYGEPFVITNYAKLIFNCNELPKEVEQTNAFFRRFLIVPFNVTIPEAEQDKELSKKIIDNELSGVFNWVLDGLNRLLSQKGFSKSSAIEKQVEQYKTESDSVKMFIEEESYEKSTISKKYLKDIYTEYADYCKSNGYRPCNTKSLSKRLTNIGFEMTRNKQGSQVYIEKKDFVEPTLSTSSTPMIFDSGVGSVANVA